MGLFDSKSTTNENKSTLKRYYLEVIGGVKEEQKYLVKAIDLQIDNMSYIFYNEEGNIVSIYPVARTIIRSIEEL